MFFENLTFFIYDSQFESISLIKWLCEYSQELIYKKSIRKDLHEYVKTTPPHVKAARKLDKLESNIISYYITIDGPEPIQNLKHKIDYEHYINKQIQPIAKAILETLNIDFEEILQGGKQTTLFN